MTPSADPAAAFGDTAVLTAILFAARYLLLWWRGDVRWARTAALWLRRIALAAIAVPALRLVAMTGEQPEIAGALAMLAVSVLASGLLLLAADQWISTRLRSVR